MGKYLNKRKVKIYVVFLLVSIMAWFINQLSETYTSRATFVLNYRNVPESYMLQSASKDHLEVKLEASGFHFLGFELTKKKIPIDLSEAVDNDGEFFLTQEQLEKQIENYLPNTMVLKDLDKGTVFFEYVKIITKEVPVVAAINLNLQKNCRLNGALAIHPATIKITGPKPQIDSIQSIKTAFIELKNVEEDFSVNATLVKNTSLVHTTYGTTKVTVQGKVSKFSEKVVNNVPITILHLPATMEVKTFPTTVNILCKAELGVLKTVTNKSFIVVADYTTMQEGEENVELKIRSMPNALYSATLQDRKVTDIINRK